eukprot:TRINITY_DN429_c0_g1_i1.p1 TRINITY_DN429_c0_g1~~TRINITY_DN429_c0_g1_i1.p1  ORF type:complete len:289 (-),score=67.71 TRINITY_DN429_c0_g1_i1:188-1027(-)
MRVAFAAALLVFGAVSALHAVMPAVNPPSAHAALLRSLAARISSGVAQEINNETLPSSFDARQQWPGCIGAGGILDQQDCGSCWAFAASEVLSDRFCIWSGGAINVTLSPQYTLSCEVWNLGCLCGSPPGLAWEFFVTHGVTTLGCVPYVSGDGEVPSCKSFGETCADGEPWKQYFASNFSHAGDFVHPNKHVEAIMTSLLDGPLDATFFVFEDFDDYTGGVYYHTYGKCKGLHSVKVVGWGTGTDKDSGIDYWLVQNSWGAAWGENGCARGTRTAHFL